MPDEPRQQPAITQLAEKLKQDTDPIVGAMKNVDYLLSRAAMLAGGCIIAIATAVEAGLLSEPLVVITGFIVLPALPLLGAFGWWRYIANTTLSPEFKRYQLQQTLAFCMKLAAYTVFVPFLMRAADPTVIQLVVLFAAYIVGLIGLVLSDHAEGSVAINAQAAARGCVKIAESLKDFAVETHGFAVEVHKALMHNDRDASTTDDTEHLAPPPKSSSLTQKREDVDALDGDMLDSTEDVAQDPNHP